MKAIQLAAAGRLKRLVQVGQKLFTTVGSQVWEVPEGVESICVAVLGAGQPCPSSASGDGGAVVYANNIPVKKGDKLTIKVGDASSNDSSRESSIAEFGIIAGSGTKVVLGSKGQKGFSGGRGTVDREPNWRPDPQNYIPGGNAATLTANGTTQGARQFSGQVDYSKLALGLDLATGQLVAAVTPQRPGPGAGGTRSKIKTAESVLPAGSGAVRIIWGEGRAFPDQKIVDIA